MDRFPYVLVLGCGLNLINIKEKTMQTLVQAEIYQGGYVCVEMGDNSFDLHFMSTAFEEEDKEKYEF